MADEDLAEKLAYWRRNGAPGRLSRQGTTDTRQVTNELTGGVAGYQRHHWDGRIDAKATPDPIHITVPMSGRRD